MPGSFLGASRSSVTSKHIKNIQKYTNKIVWNLQYRMLRMFGIFELLPSPASKKLPGRFEFGISKIFGIFGISKMFEFGDQR